VSERGEITSEREREREREREGERARERRERRERQWERMSVPSVSDSLFRESLELADAPSIEMVQYLKHELRLMYTPRCFEKALGNISLLRSIVEDGCPVLRASELSRALYRLLHHTSLTALIDAYEFCLEKELITLTEEVVASDLLTPYQLSLVVACRPSHQIRFFQFLLKHVAANAIVERVQGLLNTRDHQVLFFPLPVILFLLSLGVDFSAVRVPYYVLQGSSYYTLPTLKYLFEEMKRPHPPPPSRWTTGTFREDVRLYLREKKFFGREREKGRPIILS
jgi:hypothetical protein